MTSDSDDEIGWWETTPEDEPELEYGGNHPARSEPRRPEVNQHPLTSTETHLSPEFRISCFGLLIGLVSPWGWYGSGFQALRWSFQDVLWMLTDGISFAFSDLEMNPLEYIHWLMGPLLPLVFVTTFVATWYKSREGDEEFGRKASIFHLSFFGVWCFLNWFSWGGGFLPSGWDYVIFIAAAS